MRNHRRFLGFACIRFILASLSAFSLFFSLLIPSITRWAVAVLPPTACDIFFAMTSLGILLCCIIRTCCFVAWSNFRTFSSMWADSRCCFVAAVAKAKKHKNRHPTTFVIDNMRNCKEGDEKTTGKQVEMNVKLCSLFFRSKLSKVLEG